MLRSIYIAVVAVLCCCSLVDAGVLQPHQERTSTGVCSNGIYGELSILSRYPPALEFCAKTFPLPCKAGPKADRREASPSTTAAPDAASLAYNKCLKQPTSVISTLCSCIQSPKPCPTSKTTTRTSKSTTKTKTTSATTPTSTACNDAQAAFCTSQNVGTLACFCQLDVDGVTPICTNGGICPQSTNPNPPAPCDSDARCAQYYPGGPYYRCVYDYNGRFNCPPTFCATTNECRQQH